MGLDNEYDFDAARKALTASDSEAAEARSAARTAALRAAAAPDDEHLKHAAQQAQQHLDDVTKRRAVAVDGFATFTDPRTRALLTDAVPLLLLPARLETRFLGTDLLVRIYPDECSVDSFDPELSEAEVDAGARFWRDYWRAGGIESEERAAFRTLAGAYGSARAKWIATAYLPVNPDDRTDAKDPTTDVALVIADADPPATASRTALSTYWIAVWKANGNNTALAAARVALDAAIGNAETATELVSRYRPFNLADAPPSGVKHADTNVTVSWLELPDTKGEPYSGWRRAPLAALLPERFVVTLYAGSTSRSVLSRPVAEPLYVGPDPAAPDAEQIKVADDGKLSIPDPLKWLFEFDKAEAAGMALRIPLAQHEMNGFERIVVVGLRIRSDKDTAAAEFGELLAGHDHSRSGLELLPQGTPTNNTDGAPSSWSRRDDPDLAFDDVFGPEKFVDSDDPLGQRDGQVFARLLGLDTDVMRRVRGADGRDAIEAHAINTALAPGTLRYLTGVVMDPVFDTWVDELTWYYTTYVTGRGALSALRIGAQPYGIVASTAFSRIAWLKSPPAPEVVPLPSDAGGPATRMLVSNIVNKRLSFLRHLYDILGALEKYWVDASRLVGHVGDGADPHKTLLDVLGLHPGSAEFHSRRGKSLDELSSRWNLARLLGIPSEKYRAAEQRCYAVGLLRSLGYTGPEPDLLDLFFRSGQSALKGPLIEDLPLSETTPLQATTTDGRNYLKWLADAATQSLDTLRNQEGFVGDTPPRTLLFLMAQFALTRGYQDAGIRLRVRSGLLDHAAIRALVREPKSVHVNTYAGNSDSPWRRLYEADMRFTGSSTISIADHLTSMLATPPDYAVDLAEQIHAVELLANTPTARLERGLVEHIDTLTYRFDAWKLGLARYWLDLVRRSGESPYPGMYLGAYGYLEDVHPKHVALTEADLSDELAEAFKDQQPLQIDPTNGGHLHAPSLNQAVTSAVLRAGSMANRTSADPKAFSINLASARVRTALTLLEGVRSGQNVGALLGYQFERALHDAGDGIELDSTIFAFRRAFPLAADKLKPTQDPPPPASDAIEARNVVDGLTLVKQAMDPAPGSYEQLLATLGTAERTVVESAVADMIGAFDAMADLLLAEGVHQAAQNNQDRASSHLDIAAGFTAPPAPRVVETPNTGFALTCRVGLELDASATAAANDVPRVKAQPALNKWLTDALPSLSSVGCVISEVEADGTETPHQVTLSDLGLAPIDVIYLLADEGGGGLAELDDRIQRHLVETVNPRPDKSLKINYMQSSAEYSVFVASAFVKRLRGIAIKSRPLRASDVVVPSKAQKPDEIPHTVAPARLSGVLADLTAVRTRLDRAIQDGKTLLDNRPASKPQLLAGIDDRIKTVAGLLADVARFGGAFTGWGSLYGWRTEQFRDIVSKLLDLLDWMADQLTAAQELLAEENALPGGATDDQRIQLLRVAEGYVSTAVAPETTPAALRPVVQNKLAAFQAKAASIKANAVEPPNPSLSDRLSRCNAILPMGDFMAEPPTFTAFADSIETYWVQLLSILETVNDDVKKREKTAGDAMTAHNGAVDAAAKLRALQDGAAGIFGEEFRLIATFTLDAQSGAEQTAANTYFTSGSLLAHAKTELAVDNPLDTWMYGCARVRPNVRLVEDTIMLAEAHGLTNIGTLHAMQLPHKAGAPWYALDFPQKDTPDSERLAYVALARTGYDPAAQRCGLLLDEWAETVPVVDNVEDPDAEFQHTTGLAFHFDRPSQEPPQAMLLLTPATWSGAWAWDDIVTGIVETFALSRLRSVEPNHLDDTALAQFLPATVASVTTSGLLLAANYGLLNVMGTVSRSLADG